MGFAALSAYLETIDRVDAGELRFQFEETSDALSHHAAELLRRALQLGRILGWEKPETISARDLPVSLRLRANQSLNANTAHWFNRLDLDYGVSDAGALAADIERLTTIVNDEDFDTLANLWRLPTAYHYAKRSDDSHRCRAEAAECLVKRAEGTGLCHARLSRTQSGNRGIAWHSQ